MIHPAIIRRQRWIVGSLFLLVLLTIFISAGLGYSSLSYDRLLPTLFGQGSFKENFALFSVRLPRIFVTLLCGMALALSGAILQAITRNDLADPGIIGINSGAGVGMAVFFLYVPIQAGEFVYMLPLVSFASAFVTASLIYLFSYQKHTGLHPVKFVLTGVGFSMALSGVMIVLISSTDRTKVDFIANWLAGSIWGTDWPFIWALLPWLAVLIPFILYKGNALNLLGMSEPAAIGVGVAMNKERIILFIAAVALASSAVSISGGIAFVGLMAPHIAKALVGPRAQLHMPLAILIGGWLLLVADTIGRNILDPSGVPAGIMVALLGAPYFIYLLLRK